MRDPARPAEPPADEEIESLHLLLDGLHAVLSNAKRSGEFGDKIRMTQGRVVKHGNVAGRLIGDVYLVTLLA